MSINVLENGWVQDSFELKHDVYGLYRDAIVMPPEEYNALTPDEITVMKQQRLDNWAANLTYMIENPLAEVEPA